MSDVEFDRWLQTCDELLGALAETAGTDEEMRHDLGCMMLSKAAELVKVLPTLH